MEENKEFVKITKGYTKNIKSYTNCLNLLCVITLPYWIFKMDLEIILFVSFILISYHSEIPELKNSKICGISVILFDLLTFILYDKEVNCNFIYFIIIAVFELETIQFSFLKNYFKYYHIIIKILIYCTKCLLSYQVNQKFDKFLFNSLLFTFTTQIIVKVIRIHKSEQKNFTHQTNEFNNFKKMCGNYPVGIMICKVEREIETGKEKFAKIMYQNTSAQEILKLSTNCTEKEFIARMTNFEIVKESKSKKNIKFLSLLHFIMNPFHNKDDTQHSLVKCSSTNKLVIVRMNEYDFIPSFSELSENKLAKTNSSNKISICYKIISIENLTEEKKLIQNKIYKNLKSKFLLTISHELNNPLNGLIFYCDKLISEDNIFKRSNIVQKIKKLKFSIKFFIKNLNLTSKIILREKINMEITMVNFSHILNKVLNRFLPFLENKKIKYITNVQNYNNIVIKTDYNYFKFFIKNVFMYICHKIEPKKTLKMETQIFLDKKKFKLNFLKQNTNKYIYQCTNNITDTPLTNNIRIGDSVQTEGMLREILYTLSENLNLKILVNDNLSEYLVSCEIPFENLENMIEPDDIFEFTPVVNNQKNDNIKVLFRNMNVIENHKIIGMNRSNMHLKSSTKTNHSQVIFLNEKMHKIDENLDEKGLRKFVKFSKITEASNNSCNLNYVDDCNNRKNCKRDVIDNYKNENEVIILEEQISQESNLKNYVKRFSTIEKKLTTYSNLIDRIDDQNSKEKGAFVSMIKKNSSKSKGIERDTIFKYQVSELNEESCRDRKPYSNPNYINTDKITQDTTLKYINYKNLLTGKKLMPKTPNQNGECVKPQKNCCSFKDILVVDDELFNISTIKFMLKNFKLTPDTSENGLLAVQKVTESLKKNCCQKSFKLILMDVMMPVMDGIEASKKIQAIYQEYNKNMPSIIMISAHDSEEIYAKIKDISIIKEFVEKPVRKSKIEEILKKFYF